MDRLSALIVVVASWGCDSKKEQPLPGRADTTKVAQKAVSTEAFCDTQFPGATGPKFTPPEVTGGTVAPSASTWRWINVWATWCHPCVEELPRLAKWRDKLAGKYEMTFISADENEGDVAEFRKAHPDAPASPIIARAASQLEGWLASLGIQGAALPIHIFVEPSGHVRCVRAGGVRETDFAAVEKLLTE
jgi:thiol-disulfide isomerase/thioredoxin